MHNLTNDRYYRTWMFRWKRRKCFLKQKYSLRWICSILYHTCYCIYSFFFLLVTGLTKYFFMKKIIFSKCNFNIYSCKLLEFIIHILRNVDELLFFLGTHSHSYIWTWTKEIKKEKIIALLITINTNSTFLIENKMLKVMI